MLNRTLDLIRQSGVVAIVRLDDLSTAVDVAQALHAGGVNVIEFTMTNSEAPRAIRQVRDAMPDDMTVGAGSVVSESQAKQVIDVGAEFIISPVTKLNVIRTCTRYNVPVVPGAFTPTEIQTAWEAGASVVKVFPVDGLGPQYIKNVLAPLPHLRLLPTGGVTVDNIAGYLQAGAFAVGIGSSLVSSDVVAARDWDALTSRAAACTEAALSARVKV